jgi:nucleotide-binding universal stress UspA family protein
MSKPVLVGYDPRKGDRAPVDFGVAMARLTGAPLILAFVQAGAQAADFTAGSKLYGVGQVDEDLVAVCTPAVEQVEAEQKASGVRFECRQLSSTSAARALHEAAEEEDAGLLVVGSAGRSGVGRVVAGSTAQRLMHGAPCPIAVVPRGWTADGWPAAIGVGYVDTEEAREALRGAHALACRAGATLRVFTVVNASLSVVDATPILPAGMEESTAEEAREALKDLEAEHREQAQSELRAAVAALDGDVPVEADVFVGDPAETLIRVSEHLDLLVCSSRGYGPLRAVLLGSVSRRVTAEALCPVIVTPRGVEASLEALLAGAPGAAAPA